MKNLLLFLLFASAAFAQNFRSDGVVQARSGSPAPGALVAVCTQPCTVPANVSSVTPPSPLAALCSSASDVTCTSPNPVTADGLGNYHFYVSPGKYTVVFYGSGLTASRQVDQIFPCDPSNCSLPGPASVGGTLGVTNGITAAPFIGPSPWYDVTAPTYGAGTGLTNNATAFQAAITAAAVNGGTVFVPCGTYLFTASIAMASNVRFVGAAKGCVTLKFTGATDGLTVADGLQYFSIENVNIQTSSASATKAINLNGSASGIVSFTIRDVLITATGSGRWTHGIYASFAESANITGVRIFQSATIGVYMVNSANQLKFYDLELTGGLAADHTYNRGIWIDAPGTAAPEIIGATVQGCYFLGSNVFISGHNPKFYALHSEGTCAATDGGDFVVSGASEVSVIGGHIVQQVVVTGTVRGFLMDGVDAAGAVTFASTVQGAMVMNSRVASITDSGTVGSATDNFNGWLNVRSSAGGAFRNKIPPEFEPAGSGSTSAAIFPSQAAAAYANNTDIYFRDSGGTNQPTLFVTSADGWFLQYKATKTFVFRNSTPTTIMTLTDTGVTTPLQFTSSLATGTAPFSIASTTNNANLNSSWLTGSGTAAGLAGTGACATITTQSGGGAAGQATCTGTTGASTLTITPGLTAAHGWVCSIYDQTTRANLLQQTSNNTTTCTLTATSVTQNDVVVFSAIAF